MLTSALVGERIKNTREEKNMSQKMLSDNLAKLGLDISRETISKIENGSRIISAIEVKKISDVFFVDPQQFLKEVDEEQDLVLLFRRSGKFEDDEECIEELNEIQYFLKSFIRQKAIYEKN